MPPNSTPPVSFHEDSTAIPQFTETQPSFLLKLALSSGLAKNQKEAQQLLLCIFIAVALLALGVWWFSSPPNTPAPLPPPPPAPSF